MSDQSEIDLKLRNEFLENENSALKSILIDIETASNLWAQNHSNRCKNG